MIQKAFLDTNVIIDLMVNREPFAREAQEIFLLKDSFDYEVMISALTVANLAYIIDRLNKRPHGAIGKLLPLVQVVDLTSASIEETVVSVFKDFEDGLQHSLALAVGADVIVTRNVKDFKPSLIPVRTPTEFLAALKSGSNN